MGREKALHKTLRLRPPPPACTHTHHNAEEVHHFYLGVTLRMPLEEKGLRPGATMCVCEGKERLEGEEMG